MTDTQRDEPAVLSARSAVRKVRIAVVGAGPFGRAHAIELARNPEVQIVGIVAPSAERRDALAQEVHCAQTFDSVEDLIDTNLNLDGVIISAAAAVQADIAALLLQGEIPVLVEKPVAVSVDAAERLIIASEQSGAWVMPGHILRFSAPHAELAARVRAGEAGALQALSFRRHRPSNHHQLFPGVHPVMMTMIHDIDLAIWLTREPLSVVHAWQRSSSDAAQPNVVGATCVTPSGTVVTFQASWALGDAQMLPDALEVIGDTASIALAQSGRVLTQDGYADDHLTPSHPYGALAAEQSVFLRGIRLGEEPTEISLREALQGVALAHEIISRAGQSERS